MFCLHALAQLRWPFLSEAAALLNAEPDRKDDYSHYWGNPDLGLNMEHHFANDAFWIAVDARGKRKLESFVWSSSPDLRAHYTPWHFQRGRWPLPWLMRGPMRELYKAAWEKKWGFLAGTDTVESAPDHNKDVPWR